MGKVKLLVDVVSDLRNLADSIQAVADVMVGNENTPEVKAEPKKEVALEQVRAVLADKSNAGLTADVRALLLKYGASRLSEIEPSLYEDLLKEAEVLGNG